MWEGSKSTEAADLQALLMSSLLLLAGTGRESAFSGKLRWPRHLVKQNLAVSYAMVASSGVLIMVSSIIFIEFPNHKMIAQPPYSWFPNREDDAVWEFFPEMNESPSESNAVYHEIVFISWIFFLFRM
ncbi:hypothetical protein L6452_16741 [Arctium lappa]|uniref:Uncharacterized protein n=1 Tax=Arctium lappa TaxID=4217 RepID=A0ACB9C1G8_ARCLA|nr:hypothetical protein L6452_16741 [Arctium lappa]